MSSQPRKQASTRKRAKLEQLESRTLYSADPFSVGISTVEAPESPALTASDHYFDQGRSDIGQIDSTTGNETNLRQLEIIFIDEATPDYKLLVQDLTESSLHRTFEVITIGSEQDGIEVISNILAQHNDVSAVHLISHGSDGNVNIGKSVLNQRTLSANENAITEWGNAFTDDGDLLIYGCNFSATESGKSLGANIAALAQVDIASSDNRTGGPEVGGDWVLEQIVGNVETAIPFSDQLLDSYQRSFASTITVNTSADIVDGDTSSFDALTLYPGADTNISLREAILAANNQASADTIILDADTYQLSIPGSWANNIGDLDITTNITLIGADVASTSITSVAGLGDRLLEVHSGGALNISNLTIEDGTSAHGSGIYNSGDLVVDNVVFQNNNANTLQAGALLNQGTAILSNTTFLNNSGNAGGALRNSGTINISDSIFQSNSGSSAGGGIYNDNGYISISGTLLDLNTGNKGGAIFNDSGTVVVTDSIIQNNAAYSAGGGGIRNDDGDITISQSAFVNNSSDVSGGGVRNSSGTTTITNSTFSENYSGSNGAGFYNDNGNSIIRFSTFSENNADISGGGVYEAGGTVTIGSSIFSDNTALNQSWTTTDVGDVSVSEGYNYIKHTSVGSFTADPITDKVGADPLLLAFDSTSQTYPLSSMSPAIDDGGPTSITEDQRGVSRDSNPDVGAYEVNTAATSSDPVIVASSPSATYVENTTLIVDNAMSVTDSDSVDFDSGVFTVSNSGFSEATDEISINPTGIGVGEIDVSGSSVLYEGAAIGTWTGGTGATALTINLNPASSITAVNALIQSITFNHNGENPSSTSRTLTYEITDGDGGASAPVDITIDITPVNDTPEISSQAPLAVINELHYDTETTDSGEAIEIAGSAGIDLAGWSIELYSLGNQYNTVPLSGIIPDEGSGFGAIHFPIAPIQNGPDDAIALIDDSGTVVEFISYEGTVTAADGAAAGMTSVDIGVTEDGATALTSLKRQDLAINSIWLPSSPNSFGWLNTGQSSALSSSHTIDEDSTLVFSVADNTAIEISDPDTNTNLQLTLSVTSGKLAFSSSPGATGATLTLTGTLADINTELNGLVYTPAANFSGIDTLTVLIEDQDPLGSLSDTKDIEIIVNPVNDAPAGTDNTLSANEDSVITLQPSDFGFSDAIDGDLFDAVTIASLPSNGTLTLASIPVISGQLISATDIANGDLVFTPAANDNATGYADFDFQVHDDGGTANGGVDQDPIANTMTFDVLAVNDEPSGTDNTLTTSENTPLTLTTADFGFSDPIDGDAFFKVIVTPLGGGTLTLAGINVIGPLTVDIADINNGDLIFTPAPDANGTNYAAIKFQVRDDGDTANGGINTDQTINTLNIDVLKINNAPSGTDNTLSLSEDSSVTILPADFGFSDAIDGDLLDAVTIASLPANGTLTLASIPVISGQLISATDITNGDLVFTPATNDNATGYADFDFQVHDNGGTANGGVDQDQTANTMTFDVSSVNDEPAGTDNTLTTNENTPLTLTTADFGFSDPIDGDALLKVIVTPLGGGTLTLAGINVIGPLTVDIADINNGDLIFTPAPDASGTNYAAIKFQVRDDGGTANGGINTDQTINTLNIDVLNVNNAPSGADNTLSLSEDSSVTILPADFGFSDAIDGDLFDAVTITSLPANGTLTLAGLPIASGQLISVTDIANGDLVFTPAANDNATGYADFDFQVHDDGGTANGGIDQDQTANTMTFDVSSVNDEPAGTDNTLTTNENTPLTLTTADFGFSDPIDGDAFFKVIVTPLGGGTLTLAGINVIGPLTVDIADINNGDLIFTPAPDASGTNYAAIKFQVRDDGGTANGGINTDQTINTLNIDVLNVNNAPSGADNTLSLSEDSSVTILPADFGFSDAIDGDLFDAVTITSLPANGTLTLAGLPIASGQLISVTDIANGDLVFTPAANDNATGYADFDFQVHDDGGTTNGGVDQDQTANTMTFDVSSVNDEPAGTDNTLTTSENTPLTLTTADFGFSDPIDGDALLKVIVTPLGGGTLTLAGINVIGPLTVDIADINNGDLIFTPAPDANGTNYAAIKFQVRDDGGTANGGINTDQTINTLTIDVLNVNNAPSGADNTLSLTEDSSVIILPADFGFSDASDGNLFDAVTITSLPANGTLTLAGLPIASGQLINATDIANGDLVFKPAANDNATGYADFDFQVHDDGGTANGGVDQDQTANTMTFDVSSVNDEPAGTDNTLTTSENTPLTLTTADFGFSDPIDGDAFFKVIVTPLGGGTLTLAGINVIGPLTVDIADINNGDLIFTPAPDANGTNYAAIKFQVRDDGGTANGGIDTDQTINTLNIDVLGINNEPSGTDNTLTTNEDSVITLLSTDFGFTDVIDNDAFSAITISILPVNGSLTLAGVPVALNQTINIASINAGELQFTPLTGDSGAAYADFDFQVRDNGGTANGGLDIDQTPNTITIDVLSVSQAPTGTDNTTTTTEDTPIIIQSSDFGFQDPSDGDLLSAVTVTTLPTNGTLSLSGTAVTAGQTISIVDIDNGNLLFTPETEQNGPAYADFSFLVQDTGSTTNGGSVVAQSPSTLTFDVLPVNDAPIGLGSTEQITDQLIKILNLSDFNFSDTENHTLQAVIINAVPASGLLTLNGAPVNPGDALTFNDLTTSNVHYVPPNNTTTQDIIEFTVVDNGGTANGGSDTAAVPARNIINIVPVNDPPIASDNTIFLNEDNTYTFSRTDFGFSDPEDSHGFSELLVNATTGTGTLALDSSVITSPATVTVADIDNGLLTFTPDPDTNGNGIATIDFNVRDDGGTNFGGRNTSLNINTITVNVNPVNDAPLATDSIQTINEDQTHTLSLVDIGYSDPSDNHQLNSILITTAPVAGQLLLAGTPLTTGDSISLSALNNGDVKFVPAIDSNGSPYDSFSFQVQDDGGIVNNGVDTDQSPATMTFNVIPVSDAPAGADKLLSIHEDTNYVFSLPDFGFTDSLDSSPDQFHSVEITQPPVTGDLYSNGNAVVAGENISAADIVSGKLIYSPSANNYGQGFDNFLFRVTDTGNPANGGEIQDQTDNQILFDITNVSDAPTGTDSTITLNEDAAYTIQDSDLGFSDVEDGDTLAAITVLNLPGNGTLTLNGVTITANQVISITEVNNGDLVFTPHQNDNGINYADFTYLVHDTGTTANGGLNIAQTSNTTTFTVDSVNDAPTATGSTVSITESSAYLFNIADFGYSDTADGHLLQQVIFTQLPVAGTLSLNGAALQPNQPVNAIEIESGNLVYQPIPGQWGLPFDTLQYRVQDNGGTLNGGQDTSALPETIIFNVTEVNTPPSGNDTVITISEHQTRIVNESDFGFSDTQDNHDFTSVIITSLSSNGLVYDGAPVSVGDEISRTDITAGLLSYTANPANTTHQIGFQVTDSGNPENGPIADPSENTISFDLALVNDAPDLINEGATYAEGSDNTISATVLGAIDPDDPAQELHFTLQSIPENGQLIADGEILYPGDAFTMQQLSLGAIQYIHDGSETNSDYFDFSLADGGEDGVAPVTARFNIDITEEVDPVPPLPDNSLTLTAGDSFDTALGDILNSGESTLLDRTLLGSGLFEIEIIDQPDYGTVTLNPDGTFFYQHDGSNADTDFFVYRVTNDDGASATATVNIIAEPIFNSAKAAPLDTESIFVTVPDNSTVTDTQQEESTLEVELLTEQEPDEADTTEVTKNVASSDSEALAAEQQTNQATSLSSEEAQFSVNAVPSTSAFQNLPGSIDSVTYTDYDFEVAASLVERDLLRSLDVRQHNENASIYLFEQYNNTVVSVSSIDIRVDLPTSLSETVNNKDFLRGLSRAQSDLESAESSERRRYEVGGDVAISVSISTTAGILAWLLRGGALFGSLMAATPLWSSIDPLRITGTKKEKEADRSEVEDMFK